MRNVRMPQLAVTFAALLALSSTPAKSADAGLFSRPVSLQPAISFWTRVYTLVDSNAGYVHDSRHLDIVYEKLQFKRYSSPEEQEQAIEQAVQRYRIALLALAESKRAGLDNDEQKSLVLWGKRATPEALRTAAGNVRFQRGQADRVRDGIVRAGAWEDHIRQTLRDLELPTALAALPHVESSYHPQVSSRVGAAGLWQFTRFTGSIYLRVDHVVDERLDPFKSTEAAARLLQKNYSVLKSWPLAITAYNHGMSGVRRAVRETGTTDIGEIVRDYAGPRFGFASRNFYAAFLAVLDVTSSAERYFGKIDRHSPYDVRIIEVPAFLPATSLTEQLEVEAERLKELNPGLQRSVWNGSKFVPKGYRLRLPPDTGNGDVTAQIERLAMEEGHAIQIPDRYYKVQWGDTLSGVAQRHNISVRDLMALNNLLSKHRIRAGQSLRLPGTPIPRAIHTRATISSRDIVNGTVSPTSATRVSDHSLPSGS